MALSQNANLTVLKLGYNNLGDDGIATLATGIAVHKSVVLLDLGFNNFGDEGAKALALAMREAAKRGGKLRTLYLAGNSIGEDGALAMADFIRQGSRLRKLYMTGNRIGADGVKAITEAILEDEIRREEQRTMDEDVENPANDGLKAVSTKTTFEGMQELFFGGTGMGTMGCQAVARLLESTSCLRVISLPNCDMGDEELGMLASSIKANKSRLPLESIQLSFNNITHKGLESLTNAVWGSNTLRELKLDNNEIGDRGAHQVAAILPALKALEVLDVGFNSVKAAGLNVLMKAVAESETLQSLSVSGNDIDVASAKAVAYALAYNQSLQSLLLVHCSINHDGQRHISAGAVSNSRTGLRNLTGFPMGRKYNY
jgi:Ran GTPase-activating protein (RanGAP) involved in mRNA processing and transport